MACSNQSRTFAQSEGVVVGYLKTEAGGGSVSEVNAGGRLNRVYIYPRVYVYTHCQKRGGAKKRAGPIQDRILPLPVTRSCSSSISP
jgi:hypothetical protein